MSAPRFPDPPAQLGPIGRGEWGRALQAMDAAGFLELPTDLLAVELYCGSLDMLAGFEVEVLLHGADFPVVESDDGKPVATTMGALRDQWQAEVAEQATSLGLTPASRDAIQRALAEHPLDPEETARRQAWARQVFRGVAEIQKAARRRTRRGRYE